MKTYTKEELNEILHRHALWLADEPDGERANLSGANLSDANLGRANLSGANLSDADLRCANLYGADLSDADLSDANLGCANLSDANLGRANLSDADLSDAKIDDACCPLACPEKGSFIGWKKCRDGAIVELLIPEDARRSSSTGRKCRCDKAKVVSITDKGGNPVDVAASTYNSSFLYRVGEAVTVSDFDPDRWKECAPGIHFFITRGEAERY